MAITKNQKKEILKEIQETVKKSPSVVFVNFKKLKVNDTNKFRKALRDKGVGYLVAKKTLFKKAIDELKAVGTMPELAGELAIAHGKDSTAPAREVYEFSKKFKENISIVGGIFEGKYMSKEEMLAIAMIPSVEVLRGQFVNIINSPIQGLVLALDAIAKKKA